MTDYGLVFGLPSQWRHRDTVLMLCTLAMFSTSVARISFSPLVPAITETYAVSNTLIGLALTGMWLMYGVVQYPSGIIANRYGERTIILTALGGTVVTCLLITVSPLFIMFVIGTVLLGTVAGMHYSVATSLLTQTYENVGTAIGVHHLGGAAGGLFGPLAAAWFLRRYGWQHAVAGAAVLAMVIFVLFWWFVKPTDNVTTNNKNSDPNQSVVSRARETLQTPTIMSLVCVTVLYMFVGQAVISFLPTFLVEFQGQSTAFAGTAFAIFFVIHGIMQTGIGFLADSFNRNWLTGGCLVLGIIGFGMLIAGSGTAMLIIASAVVGIGTCGMTVLIAQMMDRLPDDDLSSGFGLTQTIVMIGGSLGSVAVGLAADFFGWGIAFGLLSALLAVALFMYTFNIPDLRSVNPIEEP